MWRTDRSRLRERVGTTRSTVKPKSFEAARRIAFCLLLAVGGLPVAQAADDATEPAEAPQQSIVESASSASPLAKARSRRLRFRNGPVCLCADGLSERDIQAAAAARNTRTNSPSTDQPTTK